MSSASADGAATPEDGGPTTDWQVALCVMCLLDAVDVDAAKKRNGDRRVSQMGCVIGCWCQLQEEGTDASLKCK